MNLLDIAARVSRVALFVALLGAPRLALAQEEVELVGLFEGHGIAHPKDPVKRRRAIVAAQRLSLECQHICRDCDGGTGLESAPCRDGELVLSHIGPESAAAILDVLDGPRDQDSDRMRPRRLILPWADAFSALVLTLGNTGRVDLVPIILKALERLDERESLSDPRVQAFGRNHIGDLLQALSTITYITNLDLYAINKSREYSEPITRQDFAAWYASHGVQTRTEWRQQAIERTSGLLKDENADVCYKAQSRLVEFEETKAATISGLKAHVRRPECAHWACPNERSILQSAEPWAKWAPPEWTPP